MNIYPAITHEEMKPTVAAGEDTNTSEIYLVFPQCMKMSRFK